MLLQPYSLDELKFAWCNRIYFRTRTHRRKRIQNLATLKSQDLADILQPYEIHLLEFVATDQEIQGLLSLKPTETTSAAISKTKGRISKWLSDHTLNSESDRNHLAKGYFAVTVGQPDTAAIDGYLEKQSEHHGYADRIRPPVYVQLISPSAETTARLQADHALMLLRYHLVFASPYRRGVFTDESAAEVTNRWLEIQQSYLINKVSFLPDHVHVAVAVHPTVSPAVVVCELLNSAQELMWERFSQLVIRARNDRLWQASAYIGSYGDLSGNAVAAYMRRWSEGGVE